MGKNKQVQPQWTDRDSALWHTCELAADLAQGRAPQAHLEVLTPFPPQFARDELSWAAGPFQLLERISPGDGSYVHNGGFFFATGPIGLAATAAVALGKAAGNSSRRRAAEASAVPRWMPIDTGMIYVSAYGFYLSGEGGLYPWSWGSISMGSMVEPGAMHLTGQTARGTISWILRSDWQSSSSSPGRSLSTRGIPSS